jgi:hypothetical protein
MLMRKEQIKNIMVNVILYRAFINTSIGVILSRVGKPRVEAAIGSEQGNPLKMSRLTPGDIDTERNLRLVARATEGKGCKKAFEERIADMQEPLRTATQKAYQFAQGIEYSHGNLSSETYLAHPLRVGLMALDCIPAPDEETVAIALIHNVLEVGKISVADINSAFGSTVASTIETLTVDREQQWDTVYKQGYYKNISLGFKGGCQVKVLDKLDNMYMLGLNPDDTIRLRYLSEIRKHVLPLASDFLPSIESYMTTLADEVESTGHFSLPELEK